VFETLDAITRASYRSFSHLPNASLIDDGEVFGVTTDVPLPFFNGIATTRLRDTSRVGEIAQRLQARGRGFRWWLTPDTTPADLGEVLPEHGLRHAYDSLGLTADLAKLRPVSVPGLRIARMKNDSEMAAWSHVISTVFEISPADRQTWVDTFRHFGFADDAQWAHFVGFLDDRPVATTTICIDGEITGVYHVATLPEARGRGAASALTVAALQHARDRGAREAGLQASAMAESVYQSIGFVPRATIRLYDWRPQ
jgi:GNAT superfamily N-acetyltransferase